ncbi:TetR/AcrR family transcriptional regulator, partial [Leucobacter soli]
MRNSRADVVEAALRVLDAHGLENCSMRRVAAELGVQPSALYHHVPDKQTLLALMADEIVRGVAAPGAVRGSAPGA